MPTCPAESPQLQPCSPSQSPGGTVCGWKGEAHYYDVVFAIRSTPTPPGLPNQAAAAEIKGPWWLFWKGVSGSFEAGTSVCCFP